MQNPPINPGEFEEEIRRSVILEKLQGALTDWITVADADVTAEFNRRNEKVKLAVVAFPADKFKDGVAVTDAEVASHFEANKDTYRIPEKRKIKYALIDLQSIRQRTTVSAQDVQRYYDDNQQQYSTPEQVRASHILLKTEGKDDAAVKKQAEDMLAKVKGGADFAALATKLSEDEVSAAKGGELDFFGQGAMVKEFEDVAFALKPGETSDLVKSQFGYHIIRRDRQESRPRHARSTKSRVQIEDIIKSERAQKEAERISNELAGKLTKPEDLDTVAKGRGLAVGESGFFARDEPIVGLGMAPAIGDARLRDEGRRSERGAALAERLRLHHRHRHAGVAPAGARRSEGARARRRAEDQGGRSRPSEGDGARGAAQERRRLHRRGQGRRPRSQDHRPHRPRRRAPRRRGEPRRRCRRVRAAAGRRERPDRHRHGCRDREGASRSRARPPTS